MRRKQATGLEFLRGLRRNISHNFAAEESVFELFILIRGHLGKVLIREMRSNIQNYNNGLFVMALIVVFMEICLSPNTA